MKQIVRIIGGLYRGKKLHFPNTEGLRPTPNRIRETAFNWLMHDIRGTRCLDAFAGSGALGFEAFSRGAAKVTFIEQSPIAAASIKNIINEFKCSGLTLIKIDARLYLQETTDSFDIVFLDPPFKENYLPDCLNHLLTYNTLVKNGLVYMESSKPIEMNERYWQTLRLKRTGQVEYGLFRKL